MSLDRVGKICRECFGEITEKENKKEPQHDICAAPDCHIDKGNYCDSAFLCTVYEIITMYALLTLPCL